MEHPTTHNVIVRSARVVQHAQGPEMQVDRSELDLVPRGGDLCSVIRALFLGSEPSEVVHRLDLVRQHRRCC